MRKFLFPLIALLAALCAALPARGQCVFVNVTGTITDPKGLPYSNGTISASISQGSTCALPGGGSFSGQVNAGLNVSGQFSMSLPTNASTSSPSSQWIFTVNGNSNLPPPVGTGGQSFTYTTTISAPVDLSAPLSALAPALANTGSGSGSTLPGPFASVGIFPNAGTNAVVGPDTSCVPPSSPGQFSLMYILTGSSPVLPSCPQVGVSARQLSGVTTDQFAVSDNGQVIQHLYNDPNSIAENMQTPALLSNPNFTTTYINSSLAIDTLTPGGGLTIQVNSSAPVSSYQVVPGTTCRIYANLTPDWNASCANSTAADPNMNLWYLSPHCAAQLNCTTVQWDVKEEHDCTFTATSQTVTCPEGNFVNAPAPGGDVGKIEFGTVQSGGYQGAQNNALIVPQGTISSVTNSTTVVVSIAATTNCSPGVNLCSFAWGTQADDAAIAAGEAAAWTSGNTCYTLQMPGGAAFIAKGHFNSVPGSACGGNGTSGTGIGTSDTRQQGPELAGEGAGSTILIPLPSFDYTHGAVGDSCGGIASLTNICFGAAVSLYAHDFTMDGLGVSSASSSGVVLWEAYGSTSCTGVQQRNLHFANWNNNVTSGPFGFETGSCAGSASNVYSENFGAVPCIFGGGTSTSPFSVSHMTCFGGNGEATLDIGGVVASYGGNYQGNTAVNESVVRFESNATLRSSGDFFASQASAFSGQFLIWLAGSGLDVRFSNDTLYYFSNGTSTSVILGNGGSGIIDFQNTRVTASGSNTRLFDVVSAGYNFFDGCGNVFTQGGVASTLDSPMYGSCSITGAPQTTGNIVPSAGFGTGAAVSITCTGCNAGDSRSFTFQITNGTSPTANPTVVITFPTAYLQAPRCQLPQQLGGTNAVLPVSISAFPTTTGFTFQLTGTVTASDTEIYQVNCQ